MDAAEHVAVSAHRDGFRRAGRAWSRQPEQVALADLPDGALDALLADPGITVTPVDGALPLRASGGMTLPEALHEIDDLRAALQAARNALAMRMGVVERLEARVEALQGAGPPADSDADHSPLRDADDPPARQARSSAAAGGGEASPFSGVDPSDPDHQDPGSGIGHAHPERDSGDEGNGEAGPREGAGLASDLERRDRIRSALAGMDLSRPAAVRKDGVVRVEALEAAAALADITGAERDEAWAWWRRQADPS